MSLTSYGALESGAGGKSHMLHLHCCLEFVLYYYSKGSSGPVDFRDANFDESDLEFTSFAHFLHSQAVKKAKFTQSHRSIKSKVISTSPWIKRSRISSLIIQKIYSYQSIYINWGRSHTRPTGYKNRNPSTSFRKSILHTPNPHRRTRIPTTRPKPNLT